MRPPYLDDGDVRLYLGDCIEVMAELDAESVDAVVCDPPYGLEFMGKEWDSLDGTAWRNESERDRAWQESQVGSAGINARRRNAPDYGKPSAAMQEWHEAWAREALRVLKPGGHLLAFGGTRTFHRLTCGIEDAGFEVRDCLSWLYGSGFPKSLDVSKAIDKAAGAEREVVGHADPSDPRTAMARKVYGNHMQDGAGEGVPITAPSTDAAKQWDGWGTALKPGWEPCVVARKPLAGTVAENVQAHGTGAVNVDGCRIGTEGGCAGAGAGARVYGDGLNGTFAQPVPGLGRWPANVAFDEQAAAMLDAQSGVTTSGAAGAKGTSGFAEGYDGEYSVPYGDTGGASRFFYTAKASRADRSTNGANNTHPTVKPTDLMRWLVRLVTPPGGVVLDPFAGSGSTLVAARAEGVRSIGIEREDEYAQIIAARLSQLSLFSEEAA